MQARHRPDHRARPRCVRGNECPATSQPSRRRQSHKPVPGRLATGTGARSPQSESLECAGAGGWRRCCCAPVFVAKSTRNKQSRLRSTVNPTGRADPTLDGGPTAGRAVVAGWRSTTVNCFRHRRHLQTPGRAHRRLSGRGLSRRGRWPNPTSATGAGFYIFQKARVRFCWGLSSFTSPKAV